MSSARSNPAKQFLNHLLNPARDLTGPVHTNENYVSFVTDAGELGALAGRNEAALFETTP
jgi:hypothetical protein